ncbi:uncharacterized protein AB675_10973 [Cyphellophora attinorum]|uniref:Uncharacterized protein n=1 Tax=Cyphellophora attinorum TaxID=1664694 RepID=A0A0N1H2N4_9EURO|nr:uncharacterized protein AB675_10973 [Phialophora attinorum]KPI35553.1 hypothetical protein AB675_10973 [Phialophora attinorum]
MPVVSQVVAAGHPEWFAYWVELAPGRYTAVRTIRFDAHHDLPLKLLRPLCSAPFPAKIDLPSLQGYHNAWANSILLRDAAIAAEPGVGDWLVRRASDHLLVASNGVLSKAATAGKTEEPASSMLALEREIAELRLEMIVLVLEGFWREDDGGVACAVLDDILVGWLGVEEGMYWWNYTERGELEGLRDDLELVRRWNEEN